MRELIPTKDKNLAAKAQMKHHLNKIGKLRRQRRIKRTVEFITSMIVTPVVSVMDFYSTSIIRYRNNTEFAEYRKKSLKVLTKDKLYTVIARARIGAPVRVIRDSKLYGFLSLGSVVEPSLKQLEPLKPITDNTKVSEYGLKNYLFLFTITSENGKNKWNFRFTSGDYEKTWLCIPSDTQVALDQEEEVKLQQKEVVERCMGFEEAVDPLEQPED